METPKKKKNKRSQQKEQKWIEQTTLGNFGYKKDSCFDVKDNEMPGPGNYLRDFFGEP